MNIYRLLGDAIHVASYFIMFLKIFKTRSTTGVSCKMYLLFVFVFSTRYLDLLQFISVYNTVMKVLFITMSCTMVFLIHVKFPSKHKHVDSFRIECVIIPSLMLALFINHLFTVKEVLWTFSIYLEAVAILPQLFLVMKTSEVDIYTFYSILTLASYRGLYILNWVYRYVYESWFDSISVSAGVVQTILYCITAVTMMCKYNEKQRLLKLAFINSLKEDFHFRDVLQDKKPSTDCEVPPPPYDTIYCPVPIYREEDLLKMQKHATEAESVPHVFVQKKERANEPETA